MAEEKKTSWRDLFISPPVIGAIISSTVAIMLFLVPRLLDNATSTPIPTTTSTSDEIAVVVQPEATHVEEESNQVASVPATDTPVLTSTPPQATLTQAPTVTLTQTLAPPDNVLLLFDDVAFTLYNQSGRTLSLNDVRFQSAIGGWDAVQWGDNLASALPEDNCLRLRDATSGERQPPAVCGNLYGFQLVGSTALFWLEVESFEVLNGDVVIATCLTTTETCSIYIE